MPTAEIAEPLPAILPSPAVTPLTLLDKAIAANLDPDRLDKLLTLQERWEKARAAEAYNSGMARVQQRCNVILTDAVNDHTKKRYASLPAVNNILKPVYSSEGFSLSFGTEDSPLSEHVRIICDVRHQAGHCERYRADIPLDGKGAKGGSSSMNACQATGSTYSYGRRYLICLIFNLTIENEDTDGNGRSCIGDEELAVLNGLIEEAQILGVKYDADRFRTWLAVESFDKLDRKGFLKACQYVQGNIAKARKGAAK